MTLHNSCARCGAPLTNDSTDANAFRCVDCAIVEAASRGGPYASPRYAREQEQQSESENQRRHLRVPAALPATLIDIMGSQSVIITEISAGGAKVRGSRPPVPGSPLSLILVGAGTLRARLVHWDDRTGGLEFDEKPAEIAQRLTLAAPNIGVSLTRG